MLPSVPSQTTGPVPGAPPADVPGGVSAAQGAAFDTALAQACTPAEAAQTRAGGDSALPWEQAAGPAPQAAGVSPSAAPWWRALPGEAAASGETDAATDAATAADQDAEKVSDDEKAPEPQTVPVLPLVAAVPAPPVVAEVGQALVPVVDDARAGVVTGSAEDAAKPTGTTGPATQVASRPSSSAASTASILAAPSHTTAPPHARAGALPEGPTSQDTAETDAAMAPALRTPGQEGSHRHLTPARRVAQEPGGSGVSAAAVPQNASAAPATATSTSTTTTPPATATTAPASVPDGPPPAASPVPTAVAPREEGAHRANNPVVMPDGEHDPAVSNPSSSPDAQTDTREQGQGGAQPHQPMPVRADAARSGMGPAGPALMLLTTPDGTLRLVPAATPGPLPAPASASAAETADNIERLVGSMRVLTRDQVSQATIHLRPEHFGEVSINVRVDGKAVTAVIQTDSPQVREWLQAQEGTLRSGLAEQGLQLDRLHVSRDPRHERRDAQHQQPDRRRQRRRDEPQTGTFEIAV